MFQATTTTNIEQKTDKDKKLPFIVSKHVSESKFNKIYLCVIYVHVLANRDWYIGLYR